MRGCNKIKPLTCHDVILMLVTRDAAGHRERERERGRQRRRGGRGRRPRRRMKTKRLIRDGYHFRRGMNMFFSPAGPVLSGVRVCHQSSSSSPRCSLRDTWTWQGMAVEYGTGPTEQRNQICHSAINTADPPHHPRPSCLSMHQVHQEEVVSDPSSVCPLQLQLPSEVDHQEVPPRVAHPHAHSVQTILPPVLQQA